MPDPNPADLEWQRRYEAHDTPWDKGAPAPPLLDYLKTHAITGDVLVPGCGRGHDARALAAQKKCMVLGLDLAPAAVADATRLTIEAGLFAPALFIQSDFLHLSSNLTGVFDWLVEHTCFCAIEPRLRADYVHSAAAALRSGGKLFGIFYLTPDAETGPPFSVSLEELTALFEPHFLILDSWVPTACFPHREGRERVLLLQKR